MPVADRTTVLGKEPPAGVTEMEYCAAPPVAMVCDGVPELTVKSEMTTAVPVPVSVAVCGEPVALSITDSVAVSVPVVAGVKVTEMSQLAPAARVVPQVVVSVKAVAFAPAIEMPVTVRAALPVFDRVTV